MKCGRICLSHGSQLPVIHRRKESQHFMNRAKFHSTFPILLLLKSLIFTALLMLGGWDFITSNYFFYIYHELATSLLASMFSLLSVWKGLHPPTSKVTIYWNKIRRFCIETGREIIFSRIPVNRVPEFLHLQACTYCYDHIFRFYGKKIV